MMRRLMLVVLAMSLAYAIPMVTRDARAQDADDCEPLDASSLEAVIERLSLDAEQAEWLRARLRQGGLRGPEDLEELPGSSPDLRDELEGAWCWEPAVEARASAGIRVRDDGVREESAVQVARGRAELRGKARRDPGAGPSMRGALRLARGEWTLTAGSLRARQGLGLLLVTAGDEPRGDAPVEPASGIWRPSLSFDERTATGAALSRTGARWTVGGAVLRGRSSTVQEAVTRTWGALQASRRGRLGVWGGTLVRADGWSGGFDAAGTTEAGAWSAEWRWAGAGSAQGASWSVQEGAWRLRGSLTRIGAGYSVRVTPLYRDPEDEDVSRLRVDARWQGGVSRFIRAAIEAGREPDPATRAWSRETSMQLVEVGERLLPGLRAGLVWRARARRAAGSEPFAGDTERLARGEIAYERTEWRVLFRTEERSRAAGRARLTTLRAGYAGKMNWEARAALARSEGDAPDLWWHRRRAGGFYGWDRPEAGTWIGAWVGIPRGRWMLEVSADSRDVGWEGAAAIRFRLEPPAELDPPPRGH